MDRIFDYEDLKCKIVYWILNFTKKNPNIKSFVVGACGSIDSYVMSTLCAESGFPTYVLSMIFSKEEQKNKEYINFLEKNYKNVVIIKINLLPIYEKLIDCFDLNTSKGEYTSNYLTNENTKSRIRMITLYQVAGNVGGIVVGSGNKVEDYGIGFCTKYGDCGVDIAPLGDLYKTEVWKLAKHLKVDNYYVENENDMWEDRDFNDLDNINTTYETLEYIIEFENNKNISELKKDIIVNGTEIKIYRELSNKNKHKFEKVPIFNIKSCHSPKHHI